MDNNHFLKFALIASLILNVTLVGTAGYKAYRQSKLDAVPVEGTEHRFLFEELSLKPAELKSLRESTIPFRQEITERQREIQARRAELVNLLRSENPDTGKIRDAISEISRKQEEMQQRITGHMLMVKASLDPENQKKFMDLIEQRMSSGMPPGCPPGMPGK